MPIKRAHLFQIGQHSKFRTFPCGPEHVFESAWLTIQKQRIWISAITLSRACYPSTIFMERNINQIPILFTRISKCCRSINPNRFRIRRRGFSRSTRKTCYTYLVLMIYVVSPPASFDNRKNTINISRYEYNRLLFTTRLIQLLLYTEWNSNTFHII